AAVGAGADTDTDADESADAGRPAPGPSSTVPHDGTERSHDEMAAGRGPLSGSTTADAARSTAAEAPTSIWSAGLRGRTAALWLVWFGINLSYYGAFIWIPSLLIDRGFDLTRSFTFTLIITLAQVPGYAVS